MSQEALTAEMMELVSVIEQLPDGVLLLDQERRVLLTNKPAARLIKIKPKALLGQEFPHPIEEGTMRDFDVEMLVKSAKWNGADATVLILKSLKSSGAFHLEWKLEAALERARQAESALEQLKSSASEIGTPPEESESEASQTQVSEFQRQLAETTDQLQQAAARAAEAENRVEEVRSQLNDRDRQIEELLERLAQEQSLAQTLSTREATLEEFRVKVKELEETMKKQRLNFEDRLADLENLLDAAETRVEELQKDAEGAEHHLAIELQQAVQSARDADARVESLEAELADVRERMKVSQEQAEVAEERAYELELEIERLAAELDELRTVQEQAEGEREVAQQLEHQLQELTEKYESAREELEALGLELETSVQQMASLEASVQARSQELEEARAGLAEQAAQAQAAESAQAELEQLRKEVGRLEKNLEQSEGLLEQAERADKLERKLQGALKRAQEAEERLEEERAQRNQGVENLQGGRGERAEALKGSGAAAQAFQDSVTGLPEASLMSRYLTFALQQAVRYKRHTAALSISCQDLPDLRRDRGDEFADRVLRQVAERLSSVVRGSDVFGRMEGDGFLLLLSQVSGDTVMAASMTSAVAQRIHQVLQRGFQLDEEDSVLRFSVGVSLFPQDAANGRQMLEHATEALENAKALGGNRVCFFHTDLQSQHEARVRIDREMREGLEREEFALVFQPIIDLSTLKVIGVESQICWKHPSMGVLNPVAFQELTERSEAIVSIGNWALRETFAQAAEWQKSGMAVLVSTNLVKRQLRQDDLVGTVSAGLAEVGCQPDRVLIEVGEDTATDDYPRIKENLAGLSELGVLLAMDSYGRGGCSLRRLQSDQAQVLKLSRHLLAGVPEDEQASGFLMSVLSSAHYLGKRTIATGIESEGQRNWLTQAGCRFGQGDLLGKPVTAAEVPQLISS